MCIRAYCCISLYVIIIINFTHTDNSDFDSGDITLLFNTTDSNRLCFDPQIIGDILYEGNEQFLLTFRNLPNEEVNVGPIEQACITIVDDDSKISSSQFV